MILLQVPKALGIIHYFNMKKYVPDKETAKKQLKSMGLIAFCKLYNSEVLIGPDSTINFIIKQFKKKHRKTR